MEEEGTTSQGGQPAAGSWKSKETDSSIQDAERRSSERLCLSSMNRFWASDT